MNNFEHFNLPSALADSLERMNFTSPTPIQAKAIPFALEGRDILGSAQTGSGKTAAFGIPMLAKLLEEPSGLGLVITPTRELATQVLDVFKKLIGKNKTIKTALLIGGANMGKQISDLKKRPQIIVGTPGRINDHLERRILKLQNAKFLVLDETDRMLDMGFGPQIEEIVRHIPEDRQTLLFSATLPKQIVRLSQKYLNNPERISVDCVHTPAAKIKQDLIHLADKEKYPKLIEEVQTRDGSILIFVNTKRGADELAFRLNRKDIDAKAIHGDLRQSQRERVIRGFRKQNYRVMVATDVVARGLDIPHIEHVINYDLPQCPEDYIHRIGRTARAGAEGAALCLISPRDRGKWFAIQRLLNPEAPKGKFKENEFKGPRGRRNKGGSSNDRSKKSKFFGFKKNNRRSRNARAI